MLQRKWLLFILWLLWVFGGKCHARAQFEPSRAPVIEGHNKENEHMFITIRKESLSRKPTAMNSKKVTSERNTEAFSKLNKRAGLIFYLDFRVQHENNAKSVDLPLVEKHAKSTINPKNIATFSPKYYSKNPIRKPQFVKIIENPLSGGNNQLLFSIFQKFFKRFNCERFASLVAKRELNHCFKKAFHAFYVNYSLVHVLLSLKSLFDRREVASADSYTITKHSSFIEHWRAESKRIYDPSTDFSLINTNILKSIPLDNVKRAPRNTVKINKNEKAHISATCTHENTLYHNVPTFKDNIEGEPSLALTGMQMISHTTEIGNHTFSENRPVIQQSSNLEQNVEKKRGKSVRQSVFTLLSNSEQGHTQTSKAKLQMKTTLRPSFLLTLAIPHENGKGEDYFQKGIVTDFLTVAEKKSTVITEPLIKNPENSSESFAVRKQHTNESNKHALPKDMSTTHFLSEKNVHPTEFKVHGVINETVSAHSANRTVYNDVSSTSPGMRITYRAGKYVSIFSKGMSKKSSRFQFNLQNNTNKAKGQHVPSESLNADQESLLASKEGSSFAHRNKKDDHTHSNYLSVPLSTLQKTSDCKESAKRVNRVFSVPENVSASKGGLNIGEKIELSFPEDLMNEPADEETLDSEGVAESVIIMITTFGKKIGHVEAISNNHPPMKHEDQKHVNKTPESLHLKELRTTTVDEKIYTGDTMEDLHTNMDTKETHEKSAKGSKMHNLPITVEESHSILRKEFLNRPSQYTNGKDQNKSIEESPFIDELNEKYSIPKEDTNEVKRKFVMKSTQADINKETTFYLSFHHSSELPTKPLLDAENTKFGDEIESHRKIKVKTKSVTRITYKNSEAPYFTKKIKWKKEMDEYKTSTYIDYLKDVGWKVKKKNDIPTQNYPSSTSGQKRRFFQDNTEELPERLQHRLIKKKKNVQSFPGNKKREGSERRFRARNADENEKEKEKEVLLPAGVLNNLTAALLASAIIIGLILLSCLIGACWLVYKERKNCPVFGKCLTQDTAQKESRSYQYSGSSSDKYVNSGTSGQNQVPVRSTSSSTVGKKVPVFRTPSSSVVKEDTMVYIPRSASEHEQQRLPGRLQEDTMVYIPRSASEREQQRLPGRLQEDTILSTPRSASEHEQQKLSGRLQEDTAVCTPRSASEHEQQRPSGKLQEKIWVCTPRSATEREQQKPKRSYQEKTWVCTPSSSTIFEQQKPPGRYQEDTRICTTIPATDYEQQRSPERYQEDSRARIVNREPEYEQLRQPVRYQEDTTVRTANPATEYEEQRPPGSYQEDTLVCTSNSPTDHEQQRSPGRYQEVNRPGNERHPVQQADMYSREREMRSRSFDRAATTVQGRNGFTGTSASRPVVFSRQRHGTGRRYSVKWNDCDQELATCYEEPEDPD